MQFHARVVDAQQRLKSVQLDALDLQDARQQLTRQNLQALSLEPARAWGGAAVAASTVGRSFPLLSFTQELLALLDAGLSITEVLDALIEKEPQPATRAVLTRLQQDLQSGLRLSGALAQQSVVFPPLFVGMVQAAEGTSNLHEALSRYVDYRLRMDAIRNKVISATIYPAILFVVGGAVALFLMGYVVPRFASVYEGSGRALPWASQMLLAWGSFLQNHAATVVGVLVGALLLATIGLRQASHTGAWRAWLVKLPWVGERAQVMELARLYLTLGLLLEGGLGMSQALALAASVGSPLSKSGLERVRELVTQGQPLSAAFEQEQLTTPVATRFIRAGEASGQLGNMLRKAAMFYEGETTRWIDRFTKTFEPLLMAAIGLVIGVIVLFLYMPIFDLAGTLP
jgi:general secretion pathway protein F